MSGVSLRPFRAGDLEFALAQTAREGWAGSRAWFETLRAHDPDGCFVAEDAGAPVAMATSTRFASTGWIGNLIVVPEARRQGLGDRLMRHAMARLTASGIATIRLDADPPGINIYRRLGFVEEDESRRFRLDAARAGAHAAVPLTAELLARAAALDLTSFGDDRLRLLTLLLTHAHAAFAVVRGAHIAGYAMVLPTALGYGLGPCVAEDGAAARELFGACLAACAGMTVTFGALAANTGASEMAGELGFATTAPSVRMVWGERIATARPELLFAIGNGAVG